MNEMAGNGNDTDDENNNDDVEEWNGMAFDRRNGKWMIKGKSEKVIVYPLFSNY